MEQSNQIQSVEALQESVVSAQTATDVPPLSWNEESMEYSFKDGAYTCEGIEGFFMSIESLKKAWRQKVSQEKLQQAQKELLHARDPRSDMTPAARTKSVNKALKDKKKWATP